MTKEIRRVCDYHRNGQWLFRLGYVQFLQAHPPLELHSHENMAEFVYMKRGCQTYRIEERDYRVRQQEVFFTLPHEFHSTGSDPEERSTLYYLIIDLPAAEQMHLFTDGCAEPPLTQRFSEKERVFPASPGLSNAMAALLACFDRKQTDVFFDTYIRNALSHVLMTLLEPQPQSSAPAAIDLTQSLQYLQSHAEEPLSVARLAEKEHLSRSAYHKHFIRAMGMPPGEYILNQKTERAKALLATTELTVTEIAGQLGFSSGQYFATVFKRYFNETPTAYRKKCKSATKNAV